MRQQSFADFISRRSSRSSSKAWLHLARLFLLICLAFPVWAQTPDTTPPTIGGTFFPVIISTGANGTAALPNYIPQVTAADDVGVTSITQTPPAKTPCEAGTTSVTMRAFDAAGNSTAFTFNVTVLDGTPPIVRAPAGGFTPAELDADINGEAALPDYTEQAVIVDASQIEEITQSPAPGTIVQLGVTTIALTARDAAGLTGTLSFDVAVRDGTAPTIAAPPGGFSPLELFTDPDGTVFLPNYTSQAIASDDLAVVSLTQTPFAGLRVGPGIFAITLTARDAANNTASLSFNVRVRLAAPLIRSLAATKAPVPGAAVDPRISPDAVFTAFRIPALDGNGDVAFLANWIGESGTGSGIFAGEPPALLVARGDVAPGIAGASFRALQDPVVSPGGSIAFGAFLKGAAINETNDQGLWVKFGSSVQLALREGAQVPGLPAGVRVKAITNYSLRDDGIIALVNLVTGTNAITETNDTVLLHIGPSGTRALIGEGSVVDFGFGSFRAPVAAITTLLPAAGSPAQGRWHFDGGCIARVVLSNKRAGIVHLGANAIVQPRLAVSDPAPEIGPSVFWNTVGFPGVATDGAATVVRGTLRAVPLLGIKPAVTTIDDTVLAFSADKNSPFEIFLRENDPAPGVPLGSFASFQDPIVNDQAKVSFVAALRGSGITVANDSALYFGDPTAPELLLRTGGRATNPEGTAIEAFWSRIIAHVLPDGEGRGPVFLAALRGPGVTMKNRIGLWARDSDGLIRQLIRTGDVISGKAIAGITALQPVPSALGARRGFNSDHELTVRVTLAGGGQNILKIRIP